jgi:hypothetical protein
MRVRAHCAHETLNSTFQGLEVGRRVILQASRDFADRLSSTRKSGVTEQGDESFFARCLSSRHRVAIPATTTTARGA